MSSRNSKQIHAYNLKVSRKDRERIKSQKACVIWLTGLSGSGKSTIANALELELNRKGYHTYILDGDNIRKGLNRDLGFSEKDRSENIRRVAEVAKLFVEAGLILITAFISPFVEDREKARNIIGEENFVEVFVDAPLDVCIKRDPKGLYKRALRGEIEKFTGIDSPYEKPAKPDIRIDTTTLSVEESVDLILKYLSTRGNLH